MSLATHTSRAGARRDELRVLVDELGTCTRCPEMIGPSVSGGPILSRVMLLGQAPGAREGEFGKPFAWTAGKTLFKWFDSLGVSEDRFRARVYMAAVCRCFPGKNPKGGDRVPNPTEIEECGDWLQKEMEILRPELVIPVGKLAIGRVFDKFQSKHLAKLKMKEVIGRAHRVTLFDHHFDTIPLPHPSGASTWHRTEPGKTLLAKALALLDAHPAFAAVRQGQDRAEDVAEAVPDADADTDTDSE